MDVRKIIEAGINSAKTDMGRYRIEDMNLYFDGYAEPGYDDSKSGIVATGNWNDIKNYDKETNSHIVDDDTPGRVAKLLERYGVELEWSDEWTECHSCNKIVRTSPDSYEWTPSYVVHDECEIICMNCVDPVEHLKELEDDEDKANTLFHIDPAKHGYKKVNGTFERGLHIGQDDSPQDIASKVREMDVERFLFHVESVGQFDMHFVLYVHESEYNDLLTPAVQEV